MKAFANGPASVELTSILTKLPACHSACIQGRRCITRLMKRIILSLCVGLAAFSPCATAQGQWSNSFTADDARNARERGEILPLKNILRPIESRYGGEMRRFVGLFDRNGQKVYVIDWTTRQGELVQFTINAHNGRIISVS